ncbi:MAG: SDR family NAD(P)-dependent oxidoreductase [Bacteroidota bacterium]
MKDFTIAYDIANESVAQLIDRSLSRVSFTFNHLHTGDLAEGESLADKLLSSRGVILLIISDNYLKSTKCMLRGLHTLQELSRAGRVLPIITDGLYPENGEIKRVHTTFEQITNVIQYMNYWQEEYLGYRKLKRQAPEGEEAQINSKLSIIRSVSTEVGEYLRHLRGIDYFTFERISHQKFQLFFELTNNEAIYPEYAVLPEENLVNIEEEIFESALGVDLASIPGMQMLADRPAVPNHSNGVVEEEAPALEEEEVEVLDQNAEEEVSTEEAPEIEKEEVDVPEFTAPESTTTPSPSDEEPLAKEETTSEEGEMDEETEEEILQSIFDEDDDDEEEDLLEDDFDFDDELEEDDEELEEIDLSDASENFDTVESMLESELFTNPEPSLEEANELLEKGELLAGLEVFKQLLLQSSESSDIRLQYAKAIYQYTNNVAEASAELRKIAEDDPKAAEVNLLMAEMAEEQNDLLLAKRFYEKAAILDEDIPGIFYKLGMLSTDFSDDIPKVAARYFKKAIKKAPEDPAAYYQYGILFYERLGHYKKAVKYFRKTLQLAPDHPFANYDLALIYHKIGDRITAASYYHKAYKINPELKTEENDKAFALGSLTAKGNTPLTALPVEHVDSSVLGNEQEEIIDEKIIDEEKETPERSPKEFRGTVLITGATAGIGKATAEVFARNGYRLILTGRRQERLDAIKKDYTDKWGTDVHLLCFDVRSAEATKAAIESIPEEWRQSDILINNAGLASGFGSIAEGNPEDWDKMIDTNIKGLLYMTRAISPSMVARRQGHIINVCSIAGHQVYPNGNVYCATKHAVDALTKGMRLDLYKHNIRVSQVSPAHVEETEFALVRYHGDAEKAKIYDDFQPLKAIDIAETIYFIATRPAHVNIQDIVILGTQQASANHINRSGRPSTE